MRPFHERRPTEQAAIAAASRTGRDSLPVTVAQLRTRLHVAVRNDDGAGLRLLTAHLSRASA